MRVDDIIITMEVPSNADIIVSFFFFFFLRKKGKYTAIILLLYRILALLIKNLL